ncbi:hypothetical protein [Klebsiella phage GADU21]|nr:hypothetical protein [Klebsiella phage GADU21]
MSRSTHYHHLILIYAIGRGASLPTFLVVQSVPVVLLSTTSTLSTCIINLPKIPILTKVNYRLTGFKTVLTYVLKRLL